VFAQLWEWEVARDAEGGSAGISMTRHGAMEALAKALVRRGRPTRGQVVPVILSRPVHEPSRHLRGLPSGRLCMTAWSSNGAEERMCGGRGEGRTGAPRG
jgi:hypothetical protein